MSLKLNSSGGGSVTLQEPVTASTLTLTLPAFSGTAATLASVTNNGVLFVNSSGQPTSGSALQFDGASLRLANAVGTTANGLRLDGGAQAHYWYLSDNTTSAFEIGSSAGQWKWLNSNGELMRLTSTGLGIGTSSPTNAFELRGDGKRSVAQGSTSAGLAMVEAQAFNYWSGAGGPTYTGTSINQYGSTATGTTAGLSNASLGTVAFQNGSAGLIYTNGGAPLVFGTVATERMRLDSSGNLGLGVTPSAWGNGVSLQGAAWALSTTLGFDCTALSTNARQTAYGGTSNWAYRGSASAALYTQQAGSHIWLTAPSGTAGNAISFTQAMSLTADGDLLVGTTSASNVPTKGFALMQNGSTGSIGIGHNNSGSGDTFANFGYNGSAIGSITQSGTTAVAYNTSSDYRLKNTIAPMTGALAKVAALKPVTYKWNADGSDGEGFIAHELAEVCPDAVTGAKDAVDKDGKPVYQGIDTSFLVATLTAAIQEQQAIIVSLQDTLTALTARVAALESI